MHIRSQVSRKLREVRVFARAMESKRHPILAQIIPIRRCNLACSYCNEYDSFSKPVPIEEMLQRIDRLGELGTTIITLSGGEPLLHPQCDDILRRIRATGAMATLITNGYLLTPDRIRKLNAAGLDYLQSASIMCSRTTRRRRASRCWTGSSSGWRSTLILR